MSAARDTATWTRVSLAPGARPLDLMTARFAGHTYAPHAHEEFALGVTTAGLERIGYRGARHVSGPGSIVVLEPGEPHTGGPASPDGFCYRVFYPAPELFAEVTRARPYFRDPIVQDAGLAAALLRAHRAAGRDPFALETGLLAALAALARRHGRARPPARAAGGRRIAQAVRARLTEELRTPPSLAALAAELGLSRYQVLRAFTEAEGMPPYAWLAQHRVTRARALLDTGHRPAEAAALTGFADQAHLTRWFRRVLGVTPGAYRNSVQDATRHRA